MKRGSLGPLVALAAALALAACTADRDLTTPELYGKYCARCHGDDGRGAERYRGRKPGADLTASKMVASGDRALVERRIVYGYGPMPAYGRRLSKPDLDRLVDFVFSLHAPAAHRRQKE